MRVPYLPEHPEPLLLAGLCWMHTRPLGRLLPQTCAECFGGVFDTAALHLLKSVWNRDLQDTAQGLRVGFRVVTDIRFRVVPFLLCIHYWDEFGTGHEWKPL